MTDPFIHIEGLYKIFGENPESVLPLVEEGRSKDDILAETGHTLGLKDINLSIGKGRIFVIGATICALLVLMNVLMMRWNVVIGGQEIAKTGKGLLSYQMPLWGHESFISASILLIAPFVLLWVLTRLFPPWVDPPGTA